MKNLLPALLCAIMVSCTSNVVTDQKIVVAKIKVMTNYGAVDTIELKTTFPISIILSSDGELYCDGVSEDGKRIEHMNRIGYNISTYKIISYQ